MKSIFNAAALAAFSLLCTSSWALGLGRLTVKSALGEPLRAEIDVTSISTDEAASLKVRLASPQTYSAAGVELNQSLASATLKLDKRSNGAPIIRLSTDSAITVPFVDVILVVQWSSGQMMREYTLLLDPPTSSNSNSYSQPTQSVAPALSAAPVVAAPIDSTSGEEKTAATPSSSPDSSNNQALKSPPLTNEEAASSPTIPQAISNTSTNSKDPIGQPSKITSASTGDTSTSFKLSKEPTNNELIYVRSGDTVSGLSDKQLPPGVSLDQMMAGLFMNNQHAFVRKNINRLKAGVVLKVPSVETIQNISPNKARRMIVAHSADFEAYRQRLASGVTSSVATSNQRQAVGKVIAKVTDQKEVVASTPDKLTLSKGAVTSASAIAPEDVIAQNRDQQNATAKIAELSRNLDELRKIKDEAAITPAASSSLASSSSGLSEATSVPTTDISEAATSGVNPVSTPTAEVAEAVTSSVASPLSASATQPEPTKISLLERFSPAIWAGLGGLFVLLVASLVYLRFGRKKANNPTSFIDSQLQPDTFFGASGGQRIDTNESGQSSMNYSLSQLDPIGDVDPLAEADVYLAYGRDLQAEEILKEALRNHPQASAVRTKLIEVYVKRQDAQSAEYVAKELYRMTKGEGPDWQRATELGASIDPNNPLYKQGISSYSSSDANQTLPLTSSSKNSSAFSRTTSDEDLDLDISLPPTPEMMDTMSFDTEVSNIKSIPTSALDVRDPSVNFDLTPDKPEIKTASNAPFDFGSINLDFNESNEGFGGAPKLTQDDLAPVTSIESFPDDKLDEHINRKIQLANEFIQIGDENAAKDLLMEVISKGNASTKAHAQILLDRLNAS